MESTYQVETRSTGLLMSTRNMNVRKRKEVRGPIEHYQNWLYHTGCPTQGDHLAVALVKSKAWTFGERHCRRLASSRLRANDSVILVDPAGLEDLLKRIREREDT